MVLTHHRVHRRDDALAVSVVEDIIDGGGSNAVARSHIAVDRDVEQQTPVQLIGRDACDARQRSYLLEEQGSPVMEFASVGVR